MGNTRALVIVEYKALGRHLSVAAAVSKHVAADDVAHEPVVRLYVLCMDGRYTHINTYIHMYVHMYMHIYIHTYIHTYVHACMHAYSTRTCGTMRSLRAPHMVAPQSETHPELGCSLN